MVMRKVLLFFTAVSLFSSCLGNFMLNKNKKIIGNYYIYAADDESQATISVYKKNYNAYIGVTPQGIKKYVVLNNKYIIGKGKKKYYLIRIGDDSSKEYDFKSMNDFLKTLKKDLDSIEWEEI